jgi:hypothetical protein
MKEDLREEIIDWVGKNVMRYIIKKPSDYYNEMIKDAIIEFGSRVEAEDFKDQIAVLVRKRLNKEL